MKKVSTDTLLPPELDWVAANILFSGCEDWDGTLEGVDSVSDLGGRPWAPSSDEAQLNELIAKEGITVAPDGPDAKEPWRAVITPNQAEPHYFFRYFGATKAIAALRCFAVFHRGAEVEIPMVAQLQEQRPVERG